MNNWTLREIEDLTENILYEYDVTIPIINIEELVEKIGGKVVYDNLEFDSSCIEKTDDKSFFIKINTNDDWFMRHYEDKNYIKRIIAYELGHLFIYTRYQTNNELWKSIPIKKEYHTHLQELDNILIFRDCLFMPRNDFARIIEKYKTKDNTIDPQEIADYFHIGYGDVINRGRILGFFDI
jgi:hypothetical protein